MDRPYFLMGDQSDPVYLWSWQSDPNGGSEALARGPDRIDALASTEGGLETAAVHADGRWRVQFTRALTTADSTDRLQLVAGRAIPVAFFAWDGSNGESGTRMAVGSWLSVYLDQPASAGVVVWPLLAVLVTGGLGLIVVKRAQRAAAGAAR
jgi:DMSO reductase family type II enzyme heme b subunit